MSRFLLDPIGFRFDGRPIFGFRGAEGEGDGGDGGDTGNGNDGGDTGTTGDGPDDPARLKRSLDAARGDARTARDELRPVKAVLRELGIDSPEALRAALTKSAPKDAPVDVEKIRETERAKLQLETNREIALVRVEAAAKGMFADPDDAVGHLRKNVDDLLGRDGKPDPKLIERELNDLLEAKPHWGVRGQKDGDLPFDGGARTTAGGVKTMDGWLRKESARKRGH